MWQLNSTGQISTQMAKKIVFMKYRCGVSKINPFFSLESDFTYVTNLGCKAVDSFCR